MPWRIPRTCTISLGCCRAPSRADGREDGRASTSAKLCGAGRCSAFHAVAGVAYRSLDRVKICGWDEVRDAAAHVDGPLGVVQNLVMGKALCRLPDYAEFESDLPG